MDTVSARPTTEDEVSPPADRRFDTSWVLGLFGTAVGAGILFLPLNAGAGGLWPLVVATLLVGPMTYLAHRALSRLVLAAPDSTGDITQVVRAYFGEGAGRFVTVLYTASFLPIVPIYGVGITNTVDSFMRHQLGMTPPPRWILAGVLVALMTGVMVAGQRLMLRITSLLVFPLAAVLVGVTLYLVPSWRFDFVRDVTPAPAGEMLMSIWLVIPVLVFATNHAAAVSQFSLSLKEKYGPGANARATWIMRRASAMLVVVTMAFVWSCALALGTDGLQAAREENLPVLSYLANVHDAPVIAYLGPIVAIFAIASSFFGHYLGASEGVAGIVRFADPDGTRFPERAVKIGVTVFIFLLTWFVAVVNPSILTLIESLSGPIMAAITLLLPMYAIHKVEALRPYRGRISNVFITVMGVIAVGGVVAGLLP